MIKISLLILTLTIFTGCVGKRGVSLKYYNDCEEYYDMQGYYHKKCDDEGMVTYKSVGEAGVNTANAIGKAGANTANTIGEAAINTAEVIGDAFKEKKKEVKIDKNVW